MTSSDQDQPDSASINTCSNCFAEFEWTPFTQDGEEFCCSGCADGGPCICTYNGAPHLPVVASASVGERPEDEQDAADGPEQDESLTAASAAGGSPPDQPPTPGQTPEYSDDEEPPTNGRLAIIMAAISEMPVPVQEVVRARLSNIGTDDEIGEPLGLSSEEVRQLIAQGQEILNRTIGSTFRIRYIGTEELADDQTPEPEFPAFEELEDAPEHQAEPQSEDQPTEESLPEAQAADGQPDIAQAIASSFGTLASASENLAEEDQGKRDVLSETLREVGNLLRLTADRIDSDERSDIPLRDALADRQGTDDPITLIVENQPDVSELFMAVQNLESVRWTKLQSHSPERSELRLVISSLMALVRDLMTMQGALRPTRLNMVGDQIVIELPGAPVAAEYRTAAAAEAPAEATPAQPDLPEVATSANGAKPAQRFEISVDSFFGARHFIEAGSSAPHHHSYRVEATFVTSEPDRNGFAVGFASVREMVDSTVMEYSETLLNTEDPFRDIPPTTENVARVFHQKISGRLPELNAPSVGLARIRVWESPTSSASYSSSGAGTGSDAAVAS